MIDRVNTDKHGFFSLKGLLHCTSQPPGKSNNYQAISLNLKWYVGKKNADFIQDDAAVRSEKTSRSGNHSAPGKRICELALKSLEEP
jgi:hypothetical protein